VPLSSGETDVKPDLIVDDVYDHVDVFLVVWQHPAWVVQSG